MMSIDPFLWITPIIAGTAVGCVRGWCFGRNGTEEIPVAARYWRVISLTFVLNFLFFWLMIGYAIATTDWNPDNFSISMVTVCMLVLVVASALFGCLLGWPVATVVSLGVLSIIRMVKWCRTSHSTGT